MFERGWVIPERLIYCPVEPYKERWTELVGVKDGMFARRLQHCGIPFLAIRPDDGVRTIRHGAVMDTLERCRWAFQQVEMVITAIQNGVIVPGQDVLYWEDFWTPGLEAIPYCQTLMFGPDRRKWIPMYAFCHAQSVDPNDFTSPMKSWIRSFEKAVAGVLDGIFVAAPELVHMLYMGGVTQTSQAVAVGTVFDSTVLESIEPYRPSKVSPTVVFSSRWDKEKCPDFFLAVATEVLYERKDVRFVVCSGYDELRSNDPVLVQRALELAERFPSRFTLATGLHKAAYYSILNTAYVVFGCANQDFVGYTLLEAAYYGVAPLYPQYLTYPDALHHRERHLYEKDNLQDAKLKLYALLDSPASPHYEWVYQKYEDSVQRMLAMMDFRVPTVESLDSVLQRACSEHQ